MRFLLYVTLVLLQTATYSQDKDVEAIYHYTQAEELYNKGDVLDYMEALSELQKAEKLLKGTNPKIMYLKLLAMEKGTYLYYSYDIDTTLQYFFRTVDSKTFPTEKYMDLVKLKKEQEAKASLPGYQLSLNPDYKGALPSILTEGRYFDTVGGRRFIEWIRSPAYDQNGDKFFNESPELKAAVYWYQRAGDDTAALMRLADFYRFGYGGLSKSTEQELKLLNKAAAQGNSEAMRKLGVMYQYFDVNKLNIDQETARLLAREWYEKAAMKGNIIAIRDLGIYFSSLFMFNEAISWLQKAVDLGSIDALIALGVAYYYRGSYDKTLSKKQKYQDRSLGLTIHSKLIAEGNERAKEAHRHLHHKEIIFRLLAEDNERARETIQRLYHER